MPVQTSTAAEHAGAPIAADGSAAEAVAAARKFLLVDLENVSGIDATAARSFAMLRRSLEATGVTLVLTGALG